ncbi:MAG: PhzF family phenazine biosynthesis protein [Planctomycetes bacterium]|nr:PhzF family phenazine biosynthesis protein [Planctomycetota bacterium]
MLPLYIVDAFAARPFEGNPAAVCPLEHWIDVRTLQAIAAENALSETAFFVRRPDGDFDLRWFTPTTEVELCGHATLASGYVVLQWLDRARHVVTFHTRSGALVVERERERLTLSLPTRTPRAFDAPRELRAALGCPAVEWLRGLYTIAVLENERAVRAARPDLTSIDELSITARGDDCDFVSRFFAPALGVPEDPVTGSAHCSLAPYWAGALGKSHLSARQVSRRGGQLACEVRGEHVRLSGTCALYARGAIELDPPLAP